MLNMVKQSFIKLNWFCTPRVYSLPGNSGSWLDCKLCLNATSWLSASKKSRVAAQWCRVNMAGAVGLCFSHAEPILSLMVSLLHTFNWNRCEKYWQKPHYYSVFPVSLWYCLAAFDTALIFKLRCILKFGNWDKNSLLMTEKQSYRCIH